MVSEMKYIVMVVVAMLLAGCGTIYTPSMLSHGNIMISGDAEGMRSLGDTMAGLVSEGKAAPGTVGSYFQTRQVQDMNATRRALAPSFLEGLFGSRAKPQQMPVASNEQGS